MTAGIVAITVLVFGAQVWMGGSTDPKVMTRLGALNAERLAEHHEWYRLWAPLFLHAGIVHLAFNMFALVQLGALVELIWGWRKLLSFYALFGLAASLCSASLNGGIGTHSVGASGAILGLAGVLMGTAWWGAEPVRSSLRELLGRRLLYAVLATFAIGMLIAPMFDNWAHFGGFVTGLAIAAAEPDPHRPPRRWTPATTLLATLVLVGSIGSAAVHGHHALEDFEVRRARSLVVRASEAPDSVMAAVIAPDILDLYIQAGQAEEGRQAFQRIVDRFQRPMLLISVWSVLSESPASATRDDARVSVARRWLDVQPDHPDALNTLAWSLLTHIDPERRHPAKALEYAQQSLRKRDEPIAPDQRAAFLDTKAEALHQLGRRAAAKKTQTQAVAVAREHDLDTLDALIDRLAKFSATDGR